MKRTVEARETDQGAPAAAQAPKPSLFDSSIDNILRGVFADSYPIGEGSIDEPDENEVYRATIKLPKTKRFFTATKDIGTHITNLTDAHNLKHLHGTNTPEDCDLAHKNIERLRACGIVILDLFQVSSIEENQPLMAMQELRLVNGWEVYSPVQECNEYILEQDPNSPIDNYTDHISAILSGKKEITDDAHVEPKRDSDKVLGTLKDTRIQNLRRSVTHLVSDLEGKLPRGSVEKASHGFKINEEFITGPNQAKMNYLKKVFVPSFVNMLKLTRTLFWLSIRDTIPGAYDNENIGLREGWLIVEVAPKPAPPIPDELARLIARLGGRVPGRG